MTSTGLNRRDFLRTAAAVGAGGALGGVGAATSPATAAGKATRRPNVVVVLADDIGYSDIGCFGSEIATPNLDRIGYGGLRMTQLYNNARCCPTRASVLTGLYPTQTGVGYMVGDQGTPQYQGWLNDSSVTIAESLGAAGYRTAMSGKWHVGGTYPRATTTTVSNQGVEVTPSTRGFERSFGYLGGDTSYYRPDYIFQDGHVGPAPTDPEFFFTDAIADHAADSIRAFAGSGQPFFSYVAFTGPHFPLHAPAADIAQYRGRYLTGWDELRRSRYERAVSLGVVDPAWGGLPPRDPANPAWTDAPNKDWQDARMSAYAAQITRVDRGVGRVLATLDELGIAQDTLVLYLGDNGGNYENLAAGAHKDVPTLDGRPMRDGNDPSIYPGPDDTYASYGQSWANASNTPFAKYKHFTQEGGISTSAIAYWPGTIKAHSIDHRPLHVIDIVPTALDLAGAKYPTERAGTPTTPLEGTSFAPLLRTGSKAWNHGRQIFWEHEGNRAVRQGRFKLVSSFKTKNWELYDMQVDRPETTDLAAKRPDKVAELASAYDGWKQRVGVRQWQTGKQYRP